MHRHGLPYPTVLIPGFGHPLYFTYNNLFYYSFSSFFLDTCCIINIMQMCEFTIKKQVTTQIRIHMSLSDELHEYMSLPIC